MASVSDTQAFSAFIGNFSNMAFSHTSCKKCQNGVVNCLECADAFCKSNTARGSACGQGCMGCTFRFYETGNAYLPAATTKHTKCGQYHFWGTPCPQISTKPHSPTVPKQSAKQHSPTVPKQSAKPHSKCSCVHDFGTPCQTLVKQPTKPHSKCGCVHELGTPCPTLVKQPTKPHSKCGCVHELGTPCPTLVKQPTKPHSKCGCLHDLGTPCPSIMKQSLTIIH